MGNWKPANNLKTHRPNESELTFVSGVETKNADGAITKANVRAAVAVLKQMFADVGNPTVEVLVTLGEFGSMHFGGGWTAGNAAAHERTMGRFALQTADGKPTDTTGAGDCYRGSYCGARYGLKQTVDQAMHWAAAAGSLAVEVEGAMPSMPTKAKIAERAANPVSSPNL